ncbi:hypothetical protein C426_0068 [Lactococcus garvieae DCC43]|uniref:Uncharacterized protein n=1 Tax=Lactococcus garvieae DCC43 TaxID=1231377 RepID=K2PQA6_9LACT|nr:hypothetical protein C426_0068 [Lactococcus garvieae DCC43]
MKKNKKKSWLTGSGLVILVIMCPVVVILFVQAIIMVHYLLN